MRDIERPFISAKFLLAPIPTVVSIPEGFVITQCPPRTAAGAHRVVPKMGGGRGDRPMMTPTNIMKAGYAGRAVRGYAATSKANVR